ncbi:MAG: hypothetical protein GY838_13110 [bacterium]|nr:hypothetical protein [bacterium]
MSYETFDGNPCPGTCLLLADEGAEARTQLAAANTRVANLEKQTNKLQVDVGYWQGQYEARNKQHAALRERARQAIQAIMDELGSVGGMESVHHAANRAAVALEARSERIASLEKQNAELQDKLRKQIVLVWRCPNCEAPCDVEEGRWVCTSNQCGDSGAMPPEVVDARKESDDD